MRTSFEKVWRFDNLAIQVRTGDIGMPSLPDRPVVVEHVVVRLMDGEASVGVHGRPLTKSGKPRGSHKHLIAELCGWRGAEIALRLAEESRPESCDELVAALTRLLARIRPVGVGESC